MASIPGDIGTRNHPQRNGVGCLVAVIPYHPHRDDSLEGRLPLSLFVSASTRAEDDIYGRVAVREGSPRCVELSRSAELIRSPALLSAVTAKGTSVSTPREPHISGVNEKEERTAHCGLHLHEGAVSREVAEVN